MVVPPENGSATVKRAKVSLTNYKNCMALEVPAFIGIYRSKPNFAGSDHLTLSVADHHHGRHGAKSRPGNLRKELSGSRSATE
jgi:hypothetical protein